jgi:hypothetical protein
MNLILYLFHRHTGKPDNQKAREVLSLELAKELKEQPDVRLSLCPVVRVFPIASGLSGVLSASFR